MSSTPVQRDQFDVSRKGITHKPTGATYTPHAGAPYSGIMNLRQLGNVLTNGEDNARHTAQRRQRDYPASLKSRSSIA